MSNKDIKDLYENIGDPEKEIEKKQTSKSSSKKAVVVIIGTLLMAALIWVLVMVSKKPVNNPVDKRPEIIDDTNQIERKDSVTSDFPANIPEWAKKPRPVTFTEEEKSEMIKAYEKSGITNSLSSIPGKKDGFTNDPEKRFDESGFLPNPNYTKILSEDWNFFITDTLTRMINPVYGNWSDLQLLKGKSPISSQELYLRFDDILEKDFLSKIRKDLAEKRFPISADWKQDNTGVLTKDLSAVDFTWIGYPEKIQVEPNEDFTKGKVTADINYRVIIGDEKKDKKERITFEIKVNNEKFKISNILSWEELNEKGSTNN